MEDMSWVKETEKKFREEERERERIIDLAKKEEQRIKQQIQRFRRRHRGKPLPQIKKKDIFIPPSAFPEYKPQPRMTESEREAAREKALMEAQQKQEEEEAARRELVCALRAPIMILCSLGFPRPLPVSHAPLLSSSL